MKSYVSQGGKESYPGWQYLFKEQRRTVAHRLQLTQPQQAGYNRYFFASVDEMLEEMYDKSRVISGKAPDGRPNNPLVAFGEFIHQPSESSLAQLQNEFLDVPDHHWVFEDLQRFEVLGVFNKCPFVILHTEYFNVGRDHVWFKSRLG